MSTAERIAGIFEMGDIFDRGSRNISDVCKRFCIDHTWEPETRRAAEMHRYTFADGSVITMGGDAWDIGYRDCFCFRGAGHYEGTCNE